MCFPDNFFSYPFCAHRLAGGHETLRWRARLVSSAAGGVHFQSRGSCTEPEGSPASQDGQTTAGRTTDLAVLWKDSPELKDKLFLERAGPTTLQQAFCGPRTRPSESPRTKSNYQSLDTTPLSHRLHFCALCLVGDFEGLCTRLWKHVLIGKGSSGPTRRNYTSTILYLSILFQSANSELARVSIVAMVNII